MTTQTLQEFRCSSRIGVRTPVVIYQFHIDGSIIRSRAWTDDLSTGGVKLITEKSLGCDWLYLRIMLPELKDRVILCEVVREDQATRHLLQNSLGDVSRSCYGLRFAGIAEGFDLEAIGRADEEALSGRGVRSKG